MMTIQTSPPPMAARRSLLRRRGCSLLLAWFCTGAAMRAGRLRSTFVAGWRNTLFIALCATFIVLGAHFLHWGWYLYPLSAIAAIAIVLATGGRR